MTNLETERHVMYAYVGSRTSTKRNARGKGINVYRIDPNNGQWEHVQLLIQLNNPSFLAFDRNKEFLYAVHGDEKFVSTYEINHENGTLRLLGSQATVEQVHHPDLDPTRANNPVHLAVDPSNRFVIVASHEIGKITVHPRLSDGTLGPCTQTYHVSGIEQPMDLPVSYSRPHQILFDSTGKFVLVPAQGRAPGKGKDKVLVFSFDRETGRLTETCCTFARKGSWPRHVVLHPKNCFAYVVNEIDNTVTAYHFNDNAGMLEPFQILSTLPDSYTGDGQASEIDIHPSGQFLYASNRIHDSIAVFLIDQTTGRLTPTYWIDSGGKTPRFTVIDPDGHYFYAASEDEDRIVQFVIDPEDGCLIPTGQTINTESPVCIIFKEV
ncbi:lactonase family protein [Paenibacillus illinoisensis]|uniref:lactonase family protein n=1 Tax=Paenibacillus illinoisensis TaxID=59845 RepID=UPI003D2BE753